MTIKTTLIALAITLTSLGPATGLGAELAEGLQRSYTLESEQRYTEALAALDALSPRGDDAYVVLLRSGWLNYLAGRQADAVHAYRRAIQAAPEAVEAQLGLTLPLIASKRWSEVVKACETVLNTAPGNYLAMSRRAFALYSLGRYGEAARAYQLVLDQYPSDVDMRSGLGWSLLKQGKSDPAREAFSQALSYAPSHATATEGMRALR